MIYLIFLIAANVILAVIFKAFAKHEVDNHNAIIINYGVCVLTASMALGRFAIPGNLLQKPWFIYALILSVLFITGFNILAMAFQKCGVALTIIIQKMSLIIPIAFAVIFFNESLGWLKLIGVFAAIAAIILVNFPIRGQTLEFDRKWLILPILTFVMSGMIEIDLYYVEVASLVQDEGIVFVASAFFMAGILGLLYSIYRMIRGTHFFRTREVVAGVVLGLPNFLTIYLILVILKLGWDGSVLFPVSNVSTLLFTALVGLIFYREVANKTKIIGLLLATVAIVLIGVSQM